MLQSSFWDLTGPDDPENAENCVQIYGNDNYQLYNNSNFSGLGYDDTGNVDARYVYWGTTNEAEIEAGILDFLDNPSLGVVFYSPWAVPEPATLSLVALGALAMLLRRRARR